MNRDDFHGGPDDLDGAHWYTRESKAERPINEADPEVEIDATTGPPWGDRFERERGRNRRWPFSPGFVLRGLMNHWNRRDRPPNQLDRCGLPPDLESTNSAGSSWPWCGGPNEKAPFLYVDDRGDAMEKRP